jgi:hypothetical protein
MEKVSTFKYLGSIISVVEMNTGLEENIGYYNKFNGYINCHFGKYMR